eukprot:COSAG02_NODE_5284_length_4472_cov_2.774525_5_plen_97_part_00
MDEAIEEEVPKQALIELIVAQQSKIVEAATSAAGGKALRKRYKEILRFIENVRTEWKSDFFVYNSNRCVLLHRWKALGLQAFTSQPKQAVQNRNTD